MQRTYFIEHRGVPILLLDFSHVMNDQAALDTIAEAKHVVAGQPRSSLLTLTNVEGSHFDSKVVGALRDLVEHNRPFVRAAAVVGLSGLMRVVFSTLVHLTGRSIRAFDRMEDAKEYLAALDQSTRP
jgi:hypothetical protein